MSQRPPALLRLSDLAIVSGQPRFPDPLHVGRPNIGDRHRLVERMMNILERRWLTNNGQEVQEFERSLKEKLGSRHCIPVCNATVAIEIAIRALGLSGEVIVPSFTFIATAHALHWLGITPVFCDVAENSHNLDPEHVERLITERTSGIIGVHIWGKPSPHEQLAEIAIKNKLQVMYDASHAFACTSGGVPIGNLGRCEVFSFHATKFLNSFEGGAIATNDDDLARKIRLMQNFGFAGIDTVISPGTNGKMSEMSAAMGLTGLESLDEFIAINRRNFSHYREQIASVDGVHTVGTDEGEKSNYQYVVWEIEEERAGLSRDQLLCVLEAENILARRYFYPGCHRMQPYATLNPESGKDLPRTEALCNRVLVLPTGTAVDLHQIDAICAIVKAALADPQQVKQILRLRAESGGRYLP